MPEPVNTPVGPGTFFAIVGPSGAGKDTLLRYAAARVGDAVCFPRRIVTRRADPQLEDHGTMTPQAFAAAREAGEFSVWWQAHGLSYGVPASVDAAIASGRAVACNVSRGAIELAGRRYRNVRVVLVTAPREVLAQRLAGRGRETTASIGRRLARSNYRLPEGCDPYHVENTGSLDVAGAQLVRFLSGAVARTRVLSEKIGLSGT